MIKKISFLLFPLLIFFFFSTAIVQGDKILSPGTKLPDLLLPPLTQDEAKYLGINKTKPFYLTQIPAPFTLIEILSPFCPYCQKQAPDINRIYQYLQDDRKLTQQIKMLGIVTIGDQKAVDAFKATFGVKFPLIPDPKMEIFKAFQSPPIPFLLLINKNGEIVLTHQGYLKNVDEFYGKIKKIVTNQKESIYPRDLKSRIS